LHQVAHIVTSNKKTSAHTDEVSLQFGVAPDAADSKPLAVICTGLRYLLVSLTQLRMVQLAGYAQLGTQIVGAYQQHIYAGHAGDGVGISNALWRFKHGNQQGFAIADFVDFAQWQRRISK